VFIFLLNTLSYFTPATPVSFVKSIELGFKLCVRVNSVNFLFVGFIELVVDVLHSNIVCVQGGVEQLGCHDAQLFALRQYFLHPHFCLFVHICSVFFISWLQNLILIEKV